MGTSHGLKLCPLIRTLQGPVNKNTTIFFLTATTSWQARALLEIVLGSRVVFVIYSLLSSY